MPMDVDSDLYSDRFQIEEIVSDRTTRSGKIRFYLKYVGYPESENTWELEEDLRDDEVIQDNRDLFP